MNHKFAAAALAAAVIGGGTAAVAVAAPAPQPAHHAAVAHQPNMYYYDAAVTNGPTGRSVRALAVNSPNVYSSYKSGYVFHGNDRVFQRVTYSFRAPLTNTLNGPSGGFRVYSQLSTGGHQFDAGILATAADTYQAEYRIDGTVTVMALTPVIQPGDRMTATVWFDVHGDHALDFTVTDHSTGASVTVPDVVKPPSGKIAYAFVSSHPNYPAGCGGINPIATDCLNSRLTAGTGVSVTANNGAVGNLLHKFRVAKVVQTDDGNADGDLYSSPNNPWNNGANFGDYMRP